MPSVRAKPAFSAVQMGYSRPRPCHAALGRDPPRGAHGVSLRTVRRLSIIHARLSRATAITKTSAAICHAPLLLILTAGLANAQPLPIPSDADVAAVASRRLSIDFRADANAPLSTVDIWCTTDLARTWIAPRVEFTGQSPAIVEAPQEGLLGIYLVLRNAVGESSPPPQLGTTPHLWVFVDVVPPIVQVQSVAVERHGSRLGNDASPAIRTRDDFVLIRYAAYDAHFRARPIDIDFRREEQSSYEPIASRLENSGRFEWRPPDALAGRIRVRILAHDRGGNVQSAESPPIELSPLSPPPPAAARTRQPVAAHDLLDAPADDPTVADALGSALFRLTALQANDSVAPAAGGAASDRAFPPEAEASTAVPAALEAAQRHVARGELALAETRLTELLAADPDHADMRLMLADVQSRRRQWSLAESQYRELLRRNPDHAAAHAGLALVLAQRRDYRGARDALTAMQRLRPDDPEILMHLGDMHALLGDFAAGRSAWRRAAESNAAADLQDRIRRRLLIYREAGVR
ncbi:MAG: tetratricopeptide repeat protein [Phycisphaerae bacterium]|nr:tetratricopeptide repeat protein [Phycisphaerae bacterium]